MSASNWVHIDVVMIHRETDKAFLCELDDERQEWLPKSQIADAEDYAAGDTDCTISISEWLAKEKGIE